MAPSKSGMHEVSKFIGISKNEDATIGKVEAQLKDIVQNLYNLIVQSFDHQGPPTHDAMKREMYVQIIL